MSDSAALLAALERGDANARDALVERYRLRTRLLVEAIIPSFSPEQIDRSLETVAARLAQYLRNVSPEEAAASLDRTAVGIVRESIFDELWENLSHQIETRALFVMRRLPYAQRDADELLQDAWLRGRRGFMDFVWQGEAQFVSWIAAIMGHRVQELQRRRTSEIGRGEAGEHSGEDGAPRREPESAVATPSRQLRAIERFQKFQKALNELPESDRELLHLRYFEKLSVTETAVELEISEAAVKTRAKRARFKLREALGDSFTPALPLDCAEGRSNHSGARRANPEI